MYISKIEGLISDIKVLEEYCIALAANEREISRFGWGRASRLPSFERALLAFARINIELEDLVSEARKIDKDLHDRLKNIVENTNLLSELSKISLMIRIDTMSDPSKLELVIYSMEQALRAFNLFKYLNSSSADIFAKNQVSIFEVITLLQRTYSAIERLRRKCVEFRSIETKVINSSRLSVEKILVYIENATIEIQASAISDSNKKEILDVIHSAKMEIIGEKKSWQNMVGNLAVAATLLSGVADIPAAAKNIQSAIHYILSATELKQPAFEFPNSLIIDVTPPALPNKIGD